jgi:hypothetical protein
MALEMVERAKNAGHKQLTVTYPRDGNEATVDVTPVNACQFTVVYTGKPIFTTTQGTRLLLGNAIDNYADNPAGNPHVRQPIPGPHHPRPPRPEPEAGAQVRPAFRRGRYADGPPGSGDGQCIGPLPSAQRRTLIRTT